MMIPGGDRASARTTLEAPTLLSVRALCVAHRACKLDAGSVLPVLKAVLRSVGEMRVVHVHKDKSIRQRANGHARAARCA